MNVVILNNPNAGNGANTTYRRGGDRTFCIRYMHAVGVDFARDKLGRVKRFESWDSARRYCKRNGLTVEGDA